MRNENKDVLSDLFQGIIKELPEVKAMNESYYLAAANTIKSFEDCLGVYESSGHEEIKIKELRRVLKTHFIEAHEVIEEYYKKLTEEKV